MADSLIKLLRARIVLVRTDKSIGTGALIAPRMILTCAHVVRHAAETVSTIEVLLPNLTEPGHFLWQETAKKLYLSKKYEENKDSESGGITLTTEYPDVAVIEIEGSKAAYLDFPEVIADSTDLTDGQFLAFGFQKKERDLQRNVPQAVSLNYSGEQVDGIIRKLMFTNGLIRPGMSGAPLMERENGNIVGIVHMTMSPNDDLGAYVIPVETIWSVFEKWEQEGINQLYSTLKSKAHKREVKKQYRKAYPSFPLLQKYGVRLFILPIILFLLLWWILFHFGDIGGSGMTSLILVVVSIMASLVGNWLGEGVKFESDKLRARVGKVLFSNLFLAGFATLVLLLWAFVSTVWVYGNVSYEENIPIVYNSGQQLKQSKEKDLAPRGITRFIDVTLPFKKREVALTPKGMTSKNFEISSFSKKEFYYPKDFELEPALILRFNPRYPMRNRMENYRIEFEVERRFEDERKILYKTIFKPKKNTGTMILGRQLNANERLNDWDKEIRENLKVTNPTIKERYVNAWKNIKYFPNIDLKRRDRINIKVIKISDSTVTNQQSYSIPREADFLDRMLEIRINQ